jgi:hypothetical protein
VLATQQQGPLRLAVAGDNVYFTTYEGGAISAVPVAGGAVQVLATDGKPLDVFASATSVTWLRNTSGYTPLKSLILADRTTTELGMVPANAPGYEHATEDAASYFVTYRYFSDWGLARTAKAPTAWSVPLVVTDGRFSALASDGLHVYIASKSGIGVTTALAGDPLVPFSPGPEGAPDIAVDGRSVYWLTLGGDVLRLDKDKAGQPPIVLASGVPSLARVALDADFVYFTSGGGASGQGSLLCAPKAGGAITQLASGLAGPTGLAVHATGIYVVNHDDGTVVRLPRL